MKRIVPLALVFFLGIRAPLSAQTLPEQKPNEAEVAANKRRAEILRRPKGFITIRLAASGREPSTTPPPYTADNWMHWLSALSHGQSSIRDTGRPVLKLILTDEKEKYTFGDDIRFQQKMKNDSDGQAAFQGFDFYYQNRPKLLRNSEAVPYKAKTDNLVRSKETDPGGLFISVRLVRIEAHSDRNLEELDLSDWYDALQPGSYQLTNKYRTSFKGPWTKESAEIQFRIEPKN